MGGTRTGDNWRGISDGYSIRSLVVNRIIHDDLCLFSNISVIANFVAQSGWFFPYYEVTDISLSPRGRGRLFNRFRFRLIDAHFKPALFGIKELSLPETINFILSASQERSGESLTPLSRGLNYLIKAISRENDTTSTIIWAISAIEALLTRPSETGTLGLLEARLSAVCDTTNRDYIVGEFRKLYRFRSRFLHGTHDVPLWIGGTEFFPKSIQDPMQGLGNPKEAMVAVSIALVVLQKMVELKRFELMWETRIKQA